MKILFPKKKENHVVSCLFHKYHGTFQYESSAVVMQDHLSIAAMGEC